MNSGDDLVNYWLDDLQPAGWQGFVYVSDAIDDQHTHQSDRPLNDPEALEYPQNAQVFPLSTMRSGDRVRIISLNCEVSNQRLMGMGLMPGMVLEVISCTATGSVIVALQDTFGSTVGQSRLGLGAEMAQYVQVMAEPVMAEQFHNNTQTPHPRMERMDTRMDTMQTPPKSSVKLRDMAIGSRLKVVGYEPTAREYKRKLLAMGLTPGTELLVKRHAPLGDPTEVEVRGFRLSLRKGEASALMVEAI
ncbi:FeoA family protein [Egbenema bharatensis]|uniref:FeoA family protein n=1 Tax=Egbenema bharatensis TaxID=3463334 RepID=UPI003A83BE93